MTIAVIFVPAAHIATHAAACLDYCAAKGYQVAGIVHTDWAAAAGMLISHAAGVLVVARPEHLDPNREPRTEIVAELEHTITRTAARTRLIRRGAAT